MDNSQVIDLETFKETRLLEDLFREVCDEEPESFYEEVLSVKNNQ